MKIGIGIITMGVREIHPSIPALCDPQAVIRVQTDVARAGPGRTRNACMQYLLEEGCDHFFLFDDDCYPTMKGWEQYFIDQHASSGIHFFGLPESFKSNAICLQGEIVRWDGIVGCFSSQTRHFIDVVGGYNTAYQRYGYEDAGRNDRARRSGLCGDGPGFPSPIRSLAYIHSEDVYAEDPTPNLTPEEKARYIEINRETWRQEVTSDRIHYPLQA